MAINKTRLHLLALSVAAVFAGCAPAYRSYSECRIDCKYCAPPPLPYAHYESCVCHSCAAERYLHANISESEQVHVHD